MAHPYFIGAAVPRVFAHRGLAVPESGIAENTAAAFAAAHAAGVDYVETDAQLTRDGYPVLFHDESLQRLFGDSRAISEVSLPELRVLFAGIGGLLTVSEALASFPTLRFNIDVKSAAVAPAVGQAIATSTQRVLIASFTDEHRRDALRAARRAGATAPPAVSAGRSVIAALVSASMVRSTALARRALRGIDAVQIPERHGRLRILTRSLLHAAHANAVEVHVWTVNDPARMRALVSAGVDGIVTDHADRALEVFGGIG